jgi:hypothetical protein
MKNVKLQRRRLGKGAQELDFLLLAMGYGIEIERRDPARGWVATIVDPIDDTAILWTVCADSLQELFERVGGAVLHLPVRESFPDEGAAADVEEPKSCPACGPIEALLEGCR